MQAQRAGKRWIQNGTHNAVKYSQGKAETTTHRIAKAIICAYLSKQNVDFYTEVTLRGGGRADIYIPELELAIEVLHSERKADFTKKAYAVRTIPVYADKADEAYAYELAQGLVHDPNGTITTILTEELK